MVKMSGFVEETEKKRTDRLALSLLVPSEPGNDTVAISFVFHLEHDSLARLINPRSELGHHTLQSRAFETAEPVLRHRAIRCCRCLMDRRRYRRDQRFESLAPFLKRCVSQAALAFAKDVEEDERCGDLRR